MSTARPLASALALALVTAAAAGVASREADNLVAPVSLVLIGGALVGGIVPARWWLSVVVGLGVPAMTFSSPGGGEAPAALPLAAWMAPLVALAAGGLGAALARHQREP